MDSDQQMNGSINKDYVKSYCASYTNNILDSAFKDSPYLKGSDLKKLCDPEQINLNLLKAIFLQWETEVIKFKNPYFDHHAPAVQNALKTYMEVLSRHISIDKGSLRPLLQEAVEETLYQVFSPIYFFENFLLTSDIGNLTLDELVKFKRFLKINGAFYIELIAPWQEKNKSEIAVAEFKKRLDEVNSEWDSWEETENYASAFSKVVALNLKSLWNRPAESIEDNATASKNVNQQFAKEVVSLNDTLQKDQTTLADQLNKKADRIENIKNSLNINKQFWFVNELFGGNSREFNEVVDKIDQCNSYHEAMKALDNHSSHRSEWDMENEAAKELIELVSRRFSEPGPAFDEHPSSTK